MIFERQKRLLALVDALGGEVGGLDFQKLLFLYCQEVEETPTYEFVPYRYGGSSFTSYADKRRLMENGLLKDEERSWTLTPSGRISANVDSRVRLGMDRFAKAHAALRGDALVAEAYRRYPYHATRSEMAGLVLAGDESALAAVREASPGPTRPGLCTIGYEGRTLQGYLNRLLQDGVTLLCDVRRNAFSHKYGFSKNTLAKASDGVGIRYEHLPELGVAAGERRDLKTQADYDALFAMYERESLPKQTAALAKICAWVEASERVALTCFEKLPHHCHRHCVAEALERQYGRKLSAVNL